MTKDINTIEQGVKQIISQVLRVDMDKLVPQALLSEDLGGDSLDAVEIIMALEDEYDIEISDEDAEKLRSVKDTVDYMKTRL
jgi:acyl carrier protein